MASKSPIRVTLRFFSNAIFKPKMAYQFPIKRKVKPRKKGRFAKFSKSERNRVISTKGVEQNWDIKGKRFDIDRRYRPPPAYWRAQESNVDAFNKRWDALQKRTKR